ncbi:hypothetical protein D3C81_1704460 [compost metagenome]
MLPSRSSLSGYAVNQFRLSVWFMNKGDMPGSFSLMTFSIGSISSSFVMLFTSKPYLSTIALSKAKPTDWPSSFSVGIAYKCPFTVAACRYAGLICALVSLAYLSSKSSSGAYAPFAALVMKFHV